MAGTRTSSRAGTRSSPRSSPRSVSSSTKTSSKRSTTSTPQKSTGRQATSKTSPYFKKAVSNRRANKKAPSEDEDDDEDEDESDEASENSKADATGMTSSSSESASDNSEDEFALSDDNEGEGEEEEDFDEQIESEMDSDFLDEDDDEEAAKKRKRAGKAPKPTVKRKSTGATTTNGSSSAARPVKKAKTSTGTHEPIEGYEDEDEFDDDDVELEDGQEIAGRIYPAPKTGQVRPGLISQNTLNFLKNLHIPERNDREWFRSHEPAFRQAENEWKAFVGIVQTKFHESDPEVPILPPRDVIHRIYRDVRFSSDKTPYKKSFSLSTSRGGRKGIWAAYHLSISPHGRSLLACGVWQPGKNELASIRHSIKTDPQAFRDEIAKPEFVKLFGPPKPHPKGSRQNVFGNEDALKVAPKGVEKDHKDIDLLKLRSVAVVHPFTDEEVLAKDFQDKVAEIVAVMAPFVHRLNDMLTLPVDNGADEE